MFNYVSQSLNFLSSYLSMAEVMHYCAREMLRNAVLCIAVVTARLLKLHHGEVLYASSFCLLYARETFTKPILYYYTLAHLHFIYKMNPLETALNCFASVVLVSVGRTLSCHAFLKDYNYKVIN